MNLERGAIFGKLTVLKRLDSKREQGPRYRVGCACGRQTNVKRLEAGQGRGYGVPALHSCDVEAQIVRDQSLKTGMT